MDNKAGVSDLSVLADRRDYNIVFRYPGKSKQPLPANCLVNELEQKEPKSIETNPC